MLESVALVISSAWVWVVLVLGLFKDWLPDNARGLLNAVAAELRPFYLPAYGLSKWFYLAEHGGMSWWEWLLTANAIAFWFYSKRWLDDDDRWKRRAKKAKEVIQRVGSRLVVVPAPAGAR